METRQRSISYMTEIFDKDRGKLKAFTSREEDWPVWKCELVNKFLKQFATFANYRFRKTEVKRT